MIAISPMGILRSIGSILPERYDRAIRDGCILHLCYSVTKEADLKAAQISAEREAPRKMANLHLGQIGKRRTVVFKGGRGRERDPVLGREPCRCYWSATWRN